MERKCKNCIHFTLGVTEQQHREWSGTNWGLHADGVCNLYFPRGYVSRKPPHPAISFHHGCFQFEPRTSPDIEKAQMNIFDLERG